MDYRKEKEILRQMLLRGEIDPKEWEERNKECDRKINGKKDILSDTLKELFG